MHFSKLSFNLNAAIERQQGQVTSKCGKHLDLLLQLHVARFMAIISFCVKKNPPRINLIMKQLLSSLLIFLFICEAFLIRQFSHTLSEASTKLPHTIEGSVSLFFQPHSLSHAIFFKFSQPNLN